jgi:hypothetical protein
VGSDGLRSLAGRVAAGALALGASLAATLTYTVAAAAAFLVLCAAVLAVAEHVNGAMGFLSSYGRPPRAAARVVR